MPRWAKKHGQRLIFIIFPCVFFRFELEGGEKRALEKRSCAALGETCELKGFKRCCDPNVCDRKLVSPSSCVSCLAVGSYCLKSAACCGNNVCDVGRCKACRALNATCYRDGHCCGATVCKREKFYHPKGKCETCLAVGSFCLRSAACCGTNVCDVGSCKACRAIGASCYRNGHCCGATVCKREEWYHPKGKCADK